MMVELDMGRSLKVPPISSWALAHIGLDEEQLLAMVPHVQAMFHEMRPVFGIPGSTHSKEMQGPLSLH